MTPQGPLDVPSAASGEPALMRSGTDFVRLFSAMATPCEIRIESDAEASAAAAALAAEAEARRIEAKYSRYRADSVVGRINASQGNRIELDAETTGLIGFAAYCYEISDGLFDITSGVLRRAWRFDGNAGVPSDAAISELMPLVGWDKLTWDPPLLTLPAGMEIDLGGFGKEYAVDCALAKARARTSDPILINFGGDLRVSGPRGRGARWRVAIESVDQSGSAAGVLEISDGALATSGDARRSIVEDGKRYSHILDPRSARPILDPPRSVTVAAPTCIEAGLFSTLAMLHGQAAERFLKKERIKAWCIR